MLVLWLLLAGTTASAAPASASGPLPLLETERVAGEPTISLNKVPTTIRVGPGGDVQTIAQAARLANDGDVIEVVAGEYRGDVAVWLQKRLTIRAVGGRARLVAAGRSAEGKGIWVIRDGEFLVEGFDFEGARVPDGNGAGIRFEHGSLTVRDSRFIGNQTGILTGNDGRSELVIDRCMFSHNGHGDGQSHNLYAGKIARLVVRGSYLRAAQVGHLLKSRARVSEVSYNRLTDEGDGRASYELEFPSGGLVTAVGNHIEQGPATQNATIVSFGAEGYAWSENVLALAHNTVVNRRPAGGIFVRATEGNARALMANNLFVGTGKFSIDVPTEAIGNAAPSLDEFADPGHHDYRPSASALFVGTAAMLEGDAWRAYRPTHQYVHERQVKVLSGSVVTTPGAYQPER